MCEAVYKHLIICGSLFLLCYPTSVLAARNNRDVWGFRTAFLSVSCAVQHSLDFCRKMAVVLQGDVWPSASEAALGETM